MHERSATGKVQGTWNDSSRERKFHGTNGPGNECSRERIVTANEYSWYPFDTRCAGYIRNWKGAKFSLWGALSPLSLADYWPVLSRPVLGNSSKMSSFPNGRPKLSHFKFDLACASACFGTWRRRETACVRRRVPHSTASPATRTFNVCLATPSNHYLLPGKLATGRIGQQHT